MKSGLDILDKAVLLLGYNRADAYDNKQELAVRALDIINNISIDLNLPTIDSLSDTVKAEAKQEDALTTGVAMLLSLLEGDSNKNVIFTGLYNAKRAIALKGAGSVIDVLPYDDGGV